MACPQRGPPVGTRHFYGRRQLNHALGNRTLGDGKGLVGAFRHPTGVRRSGSSRNTRADGVIYPRYRVLQRKPGGRRVSVVQVSTRSRYAGGTEQKFLVDSGGFCRYSWFESAQADTPNRIRLSESTKKLESATANRIRMGQSVQYRRS